jgi:hypothetical protein
MLGAGLIGMFYVKTLHRNRNLDWIAAVYSRIEERVEHLLLNGTYPK